MKKIFSKQEALFANECKIINLKYEYNGYIGEERFAIVTELSEAELWEKYPDIISRYVPFVHLSDKHGEVIKEFHRNEDKFEKREKRNQEFYGYEEGLSECLCSSLIYGYEDPHQKMIREEYELKEEVIHMNELEKVKITLEKMSPIQARRLWKNICEGMNSSQIAKEEGVNHSAVNKSLKAARKNFEKIFNNLK